MFGNSVPRADYDALQTRYDALHDRYDKLVDKLVLMKRKGYETPMEAKQARVIPSGPSADELAMKRVHDALINELADDIAAIPGIDPKVARAEAQRLRDVALGGALGEPPV